MRRVTALKTGKAGWGRRLARVAGSAHRGSAGSRWLAVSGAGQCGIPGGSAAAHRAALTRARCRSAVIALLERHAGTTRETRKAAIRVLRRHLCHVTYRALHVVARRLD
jgi:hypothetical protein